MFYTGIETGRSRKLDRAKNHLEKQKYKGFFSIVQSDCSCFAIKTFLSVLNGSRAIDMLDSIDFKLFLKSIKHAPHQDQTIFLKNLR